MSRADKNLMRIVRDFRRGILNRKCSDGQCWVVCAPLAALLEVFGHKCELTEGHVGNGVHREHHFWITLGDGRIIDPTADQFRPPHHKEMPQIYIGAQPKWYRRKSPRT